MPDQINPQVKLTNRQRVLLGKLSDLYAEIQRPVHYVVVARSLGLCGSTVYDMLKVLEKKGVVISQYGLPKEHSGPGRANILFAPVAVAPEQFAMANTYDTDRREWRKVTSRILSSLRGCASCDYMKLFSGMFEKANREQSPMARSAEIMAGLLVSLKQAHYEFSEQSAVGVMLESPVSKVSMGTAAGVILGRSLADKKVRAVLNKYHDHINGYISLLQQISDENLLKLHEFALDVWNILRANPAY